MTDSELSQEFSRLIRRSGRWRDSRPNELLDRSARFVSDCVQVYSPDSTDYGDYLTARHGLGQVQGQQEWQRFSELRALHEDNVRRIH